MKPGPVFRSPAQRLRALGKLGPYDVKAAALATESATAPSPVDTAAVRAWAATHGFEVSPRGRIPAAVVEAYTDAHRVAS